MLKAEQGQGILCQPDQDILVCLCVWLSHLLNYGQFFETCIVSTFLGLVCSRKHEILFTVSMRFTGYFSKAVLGVRVRPFVLCSQLHQRPAVYWLKVRKHSWCWFIPTDLVSRQVEEMTAAMWLKLSNNTCSYCFMKLKETIRSCCRVDLLKRIVNQ